MDLYALPGLDHTPNLIMGYLPAEKILINGDMYVAPTPSFRGQAANFTLRGFADHIRRLNLDIEWHVGLHGGVGSHADFLKLIATL